MAIVLIYIPIGITTLSVYFISPAGANWFVWGTTVVLSLYMLVKSFIRYSAFRNGESMPVGEIIVMAYAPFSSAMILIASAVLLFVDVSKLHLLWAAPLASIACEFTIGTRAARKLEE